MGKGDDAIGYIEREGKIYTLPVTQGKYQEMMKEIAINQGMNINLSQNMEATQTLAQDQAIIPKTPSQSLSSTREKEPGQVTKSSQEWKKRELSEQQKLDLSDQVKGQKERSEPKVKVEKIKVEDKATCKFSTFQNIVS